MNEGTAISPVVAAQRDRFAAGRAALPGARHAAVDGRRAAGIARFESLGLPTRKLEAWKYTDLRRLEKLGLNAAASAADAALPDALRAFVPAQGPSMVFVNGRLRPDLSHFDSLPDGLRLDGYAAALEARDADVESRFAKAADAPSLVELNTALVEDGVVLRIAANAMIEAPVRLVFLSVPGAEATASHPRILLLAGANSQATVIEAYHGTGDAYFTNAVVDAEIGDGARLRHYRRQSEGLKAVHLLNGSATIGRDATYDSFTLSLGADLARTEVVATFTGRGGNGHVTGAYMADGSRHIDTTTLIDHAVPDCRSREVFKGVLDGKGRGVFQGKIIVRRDAQRTDGYQLNRAMMLSRTAEIDSKPELEIYADDVKCSHGATVGEIDAEALFYLRARGIDERTARAMLVEAFLFEALDEIADEAVRDEFGAAVEEWLHSRHQED